MLNVDSLTASLSAAPSTPKELKNATAWRVEGVTAINLNSLSSEEYPGFNAARFE
jgi:hypothetical protein